MADLPEDVIAEFQAGLSKLRTFLQSILPKESLSSDAELHRKECIAIVEDMNYSLNNNMKNNNLKQDTLLNAGLSVSSQSLNDTNEFNSINGAEVGIPRSGSLPDISNNQSENSEDWPATRTKKGSLNKYNDLDEEINLNDLRKLVLYHPIEEEEEEESDSSNDDDTHNNLALSGSNQLNTSNRSPVNKRKSRKRDSAALFDISLEDLTEPDFAGLLKEKHSEKLWWCVLIDQHLCIFPSQDPDEVAYDVIIMPCCQISLDDRLMRTPVFRLTQSGMTPWVFVTSNNNILKEWMKVLTIAASAGNNSSSQATKSEEKQFSVTHQAPVMQSIVEEEEEPIEEEEEPPPCSLKSDFNPASAQSNNNSSQLNESEDSVAVSYVNAPESQQNGYDKELPKLPDDLGELPKIPDEVDGEQFGEDVYEAVANLTAKANRAEEEYQDDGFATDEFDSGSESGGDVSPSPQAQPVQQKGKKKKQFFNWLKKKAKKDKLFSSPKDGVALAGYAHKANDTTKRWFLIREEKLHCYKTIKDDDPETTVDLKGSEIKAGEEERSKLAIHVIRDGVSQFTLVAKSAKDWERWKKAFEIESGFIKLATSPTESSSGVFEQDDEDDYVTPVISAALEKKYSLEKPEIKVQSADTQQSASGRIEDPYTEVAPTVPGAHFKPVSPSSSQQELGPLPPLPPLPPDLPPSRRSPDGMEEKEDGDSGDNLGGSDEIYEEVRSAVAHADKVIKWDGVNGGKSEVTPVSPTSPTGVHRKTSQKGPVPAGVSDGTIEDSAITASSFMDNTSRPFAGRLHSSAGAWCPNVSDKQQYLQIDLAPFISCLHSLRVVVTPGSTVGPLSILSSRNLKDVNSPKLLQISWRSRQTTKNTTVHDGEVTKVCGVASQGRPGFLDQGGWFVKTYTVAYSKDGENWANYKEFGIAKVFQANHDPDTVVTNMLKMAVSAHYVRIKPQSWHNHIALRAEVYKGAASSKLTAGIHKLADSLTKTAKGKSFNKQSTSPTTENVNAADGKPGKPTLERKVSFDDKVNYIDRQASTENLVDKDEENKTEEPVVGVQNGSVTHEEGQQADGYLVLREATNEEKEVELKVQQKIEATKKGEEGSQPVGRHEVSQGILAKRSLYESNQQSEVKSEFKRNGSPMIKQENGVTNKKEVVADKKDAEAENTESKAHIPRARKESDSYDPDKERQELEKTEKAFQAYAQQLKKEGNAREKRPSLVALNRLNFEDPDTVSKTKENRSLLEKSESLQKEKEELFKKQESLKKRISVAKDRKIFFSLSTTRSKATADAEAEFHQSQCDLAKTKKRLLEIENETKNLKVMELRYQKMPEKATNPAKPLVRKNSKECKLGPADAQPAKVDSSATVGANPEKELAQKGNVLSQIKAFEQMKKTT